MNEPTKTRILSGRSLGLIALATLSLATAQELTFESTPESRELSRMSEQLSELAKKAVQAESFEARNTLHAAAVTAESAELASRALGVTDGRGRAEIERAFWSATHVAGEAFRGAFDAKGNYLPEQEAVKKSAQNAAGGVARAYTPALVAALDGRPVPTEADRLLAESILDRARVEDVLRVLNEDVARRTSTEWTAENFAESAKRLVPEGHWSRGMLDSLPARQVGETPLNAHELKVLEGSIRLANATWKSGQVHRAVAEENPNRISVQRAGNYATFDGMQREVFERSYLEARATEGPQGAKETAYARVGFEVYKDLSEIKSGKLESPTETAERFRQTQRTLARQYASDLARKSVPELRAEALRQRVLVWSGRVDREALSKELLRQAVSHLERGTRTLEASAPKETRQGAVDRLGELAPRARGRRVRVR